MAQLSLEKGYEIHGTSPDHEVSSWFSYKHGAMIHLNGIITDTEFPCISGYMNSRIAEGFYEIVEAKTIIEGDQKKTLVASRGEVLAKA